MKRFVSIIVFLLLPLLMRAEAGNYLFEHVQTPNHWINSIFQDSDGFIWIGTRNGLYRGMGGHVLEQDVICEGDSFQDIQQDAQGRIWVKKRNGFVIYDPQTCRIGTEQEAAAELGASTWLDVVQIDSRFNLWWTDNRILKVRMAGTGQTLEAGQVDGTPYDIFCTNGIAYLLCTDGDVYRYAYGADGVRALDVVQAPVEVPEGSTDHRFHCIFTDSAGNMWLSQGARGVWMLPSDGSETIRFSEDSRGHNISGGFICAILEDADGNVWLASDHGGVTICNRRGDVLHRLKNVPDDANTLASNGVYALFRDSQDNIWVGYTKKGLSIWRGDNRTWSLSHLKTLHDYSFPDDINASCEDSRGMQWFGTDGYGLIRYNPADGTERLYNIANSALASNVITDIHCDNAGRLWIGTFYGGLTCIENGRMRTYDYDRSGAGQLASENIWAIDHDASGRIWLATLGGGLQLFNPADGSCRTFVSATHGISNDYVLDLDCAPDGNIYLATAYGLTIFNSHTCTSRVVGTADGLAFENMTGVHVDSRGLVWMDEDGLVQVYDPASGAVYTPSHSALRAVRDILEDASSAIWVVTDKGLCRVDVFRSTEHGYAFDISSYSFPQIPDLHFNQKAACMTPSGDMLLGSFCGVMRFSPDKLSARMAHDEAKLYFTRLYVGSMPVRPGQEYDGDVILEKALEYTQAVTLPHEASLISVDFTNLDYFSVQDCNLYYRLEGLSDEWITTDKNLNRLTFTSLSPGKYRLCLTPDINDPSRGITLDIRILPPWWKTWWAICLYVLAGTALLCFASLMVRRRRRMDARQRELAMKQERRHYLDEMKMQFFTNVSHDFRTPLTLILTPIEEKLAKNPELREDAFMMTVHRNAQRLLNLVNEVLDLRKIEMYGTDLNLASADFISAVRDASDSFRLMAESQSVMLSVVSDIDSLVFDFDQGKIVKVLTNLLSNAFKFTPSGGAITVDVHMDGQDHVAVEVRDTGCGVPEKDRHRIFDRFYQSKGSPAGSGIGLHVVREFIQLHGGDISVRDNEPTGSIFSFTLPVQRQSAETVDDEDVTETAFPADVPAVEGRPTVLVVDDNDDFRTFLCASLSDEYNVLYACDGAEALKAVEANDVDVVICDVMMPVMDGTEFCRRMKSDINTSHIPVILLTAKAMRDDECHGLESGADDYLTKPFNMSILRLRIAKFIQWKKRSKRLFEKELEITTEQITLTSMDDRLLQKAINVINENISNPDFSVADLSAALYMHRASLYKKLLYITGKTPVEFIRALRLKKAAQLLETDGVYISEVAYMVGFNSPKVFAGHFKEEFGCSPSEYRKKSLSSQDCNNDGQS